MKSAADIRRERDVALRTLRRMVRDFESGFIAHPGACKQWALSVAMDAIKELNYRNEKPESSGSK